MLLFPYKTVGCGHLPLLTDPFLQHLKLVCCMDEIVSSFSLFYAVIHVFRLNTKIFYVTSESLPVFVSVNDFPVIVTPRSSGISVLGHSAIIDLGSWYIHSAERVGQVYSCERSVINS